MAADAHKPLVISAAVLAAAAKPTLYSRTHGRVGLMGARGHAKSAFWVKRTCVSTLHMSAFDPKRKSEFSLVLSFPGE